MDFLKKIGALLILPVASATTTYWFNQYISIFTLIAIPLLNSWDYCVFNIFCKKSRTQRYKYRK